MSRRLNLLLIALINLIMVFIWNQWGGNAPWDDAYISFHYAQNLADGHGLVWNIGGEPTQGYTNFLFVVLLAGGIKLGISPLLLAYVLNTLGLILIGWSFYLLSAQILEEDSLLTLIIPLAVIAVPISLLNLMTGLEAIFWAGLIFSAALFTRRYIMTQSINDLRLAGLLSFACCLTRPDGVLLAGLWWLYLLVVSPKKRPVIMGIVVFGIAGVMYLVWLRLYFGNILPNPFYVKVGKSETFPGFIYVLQGIGYVGFQPVFFAGLAGLPMAVFKLRTNVIPYLVPLALLPFYIITEPLMGDHYRFLYAALCVLLFIAALGLVLLAKAIWLRFPSPILKAITVVVMIAIVCGPMFEVTRQRIMLIGPSDQPRLTGIPVRIGLALQKIPDIQNATIAYVDAGAIPYYTRCQFLDMAGLNDNTIAHNASREGSQWLADYILGHHPDVIGFYTEPDGTFFTASHGVIGTSMDELYLDPDFQENYTYVAGYDATFAVIQWFVRKDSIYAAALTNTLQANADHTEFEIVPG